MKFCQHCQRKTRSVFNDFMVEFCEECKIVRGERKKYTGVLMSFECAACGRMMDESYVGQTVCSQCLETA